MAKMRQTLMFLITTWGAEKDDTAHTTTLNVNEEVDMLWSASCTLEEIVVVSFSWGAPKIIV